MREITVVSPVYNSQDSIASFISELDSALSLTCSNYEIILVDDSSSDSTWDIILNTAPSFPHLRALRLSRNFGQHAAITAGLADTNANWVVIMDSDFQDRPDQIQYLYRTACQGFHVVLGARLARQDDALKRLYSALFNRLFSYLTNLKFDSTIANFGIYHRDVVDAMLSMGDCVRYLPYMVKWVGFKSCTIPVQHSNRLSGVSSYSTRKLFKLAFQNVFSFSNKPLYLVVSLGLFISVSAFCIGLAYICAYYFGLVTVPGFASLIISIWLATGLIIFTLGTIGLYVGSVFLQVKGRPSYLVRAKYPNYDHV